MSPNEDICGCDKRRFQLQKAKLVFHVKVVSDLFSFSLFCLVGTGKRKKKERKERKLDAQGRIIKRGPHCIFHDMERQVPKIFADKIGQLN